MFDDPRKALLDLEQALLAEEEPAAEEEFDEDALLLEEARALIGEAPGDSRGGAYLRRTGEALWDREPPKAVKTKGIGDLVVLAVLEAAGIAAIALWWLQWLI